MPKKQHDIIATTEVAKLLGIDPRTVQRKAISGELPTVSKLPGKTGPYLFNRSNILALLSPSTPTAPAADLSPRTSAVGGSSVSGAA